MIALAAAAAILYATVGRSTSSQNVHELLWIFACSQPMAAIASVVPFFVSWIAYLLVSVLAVVVVVLLAVDRPRSNKG